MKKVLYLVAGLALAYVVIVGGSGLAIKTLLSGSAGEELREKAQASLPVAVSISGGTLDLAEWFFFRPAISFSDLRVDNPEGFSAEPLFTASRVAARADLTSLFGDTLDVKSIEIIDPFLRVETAASGKTNLDALLEAIKSKSDAEPPPGESESGAAGGRQARVGSFALLNGRVEYVDAAGAPLVLRDIRVETRDFEPNGAFPLTFHAAVFEESAAIASFEGVVGPFQKASAPLKGDISIEALPNKLDPAFREQRLGNLVLAPGDSSRVAIATDLEGDVFGTLTGTGEISIEGLQLGKPNEKQLPLEGKAPVMLTLITPLSKPSFHVVMPEAELSLGAGTWRGGVEAQHDGSRLSGHSKGAISGVNVNEMLSALTESKDVAFGDMSVPSYEIRFSGRDAEEIKRSLQGSGRLELTNGQFKALDTLKTVEQKFNKLMGGEQAAAGETSFVSFVTDFQIRDQTVFTRDLLLESNELGLSGDGSFNFDQQLDFDLTSLIRGALAATLGGSKNAAGIAEVGLPMTLAGTIENPVLKPDFGAMAKNLAVGQAKGFLNRLLAPKSDATAGESPSAEPAEPEQPKLPFGLGDLIKKKLGSR